MHRPDEKFELPVGKNLSSILGLVEGNGVDDILDRSLLRPADEFLNRPSKKLRAQLVRLGFLLSGAHETHSESEKWMDGCSRVLESIHAGSLVVDDIEDGSALRRGEPTMHERHGLPIALNIGNWLYFWPMEILRGLQLPEKIELNCYRVVHSGLLKAHFGQAVDIGTSVDHLEQDKVYDICLASLELKTGALTSLAIELGALLGTPAESRINVIRRFGVSYGIALQMFDDIGNLAEKKVNGVADPKRFEDLRLRRPSWVWACAARLLEKDKYDVFLNAVKDLPDSAHLERAISCFDLKRLAHREAVQYLEKTLHQLECESFSSENERLGLECARQLSKKLLESYG